MIMKSCRTSKRGEACKPQKRKGQGVRGAKERGACEEKGKMKGMGSNRVVRRKGKEHWDREKKLLDDGKGKREARKRLLVNNKGSTRTWREKSSDWSTSKREGKGEEKGMAISCKGGYKVIGGP
jgi:hypothetical protein